MYSVLQNKKNITFKFDKFPYIVIDNALPHDLYEKLNNSFPEYKKIIGSNDFKENFAYRYNAISSLKDEEITKEWKDFIKYHTSNEFLQEFYDIFYDSIKIFIKSKKIDYLKKIILELGLKNNYLNLDCQFVINTPTSGDTKVIEPHLDNPVELYAALLYMKDVDDDSKGGNLTTYTFKDKPSFYGKSRGENKVNLLEEIEYKQND